MATNVSTIDTSKVRQLRSFKIDYSQVRNLDYIDKSDAPPQSFNEFLRIVPPTGLHTQKQDRPAFSTDLRYLASYSSVHFPKGQILVLVNSVLYPAVKNAIDQYVQDLACEGYFATTFTVNGGTPNELREFLKSKRPIAGAVLIGNLPTAWFEMDDDFDDTYSEFPCDLYYMDLNGTWSDPDNDGKFSVHANNVQPEIWIGRLWTPTSNGNDADLITDYFQRNHAFRKGWFGHSNRALAYVDDDWVGFGDCSFDLMFSASNIETITDPATTDGDRYKAEVNQHRAWAQICAHSSPNGHSFKTPAGAEWVATGYLRDFNSPNSYFYNLFACSNARFTQADYMAGWYIFDKSGGSRCNGLAAVGSTKTGSMLLFENFYGPMGSGKVIGDAFVDWWKALGVTHDLGERRWYYGLVILGDPTLNWWTGIVPQLRDPLPDDDFDHFPRLTHFRWDPICLPSVTYNIEIDAFGARNSGQWTAESGQTWFVSGALKDNQFDHLFIGMQRGRWRVRAKLSGHTGPWSDWRYFEYKV